MSRLGCVLDFDEGSVGIPERADVCVVGAGAAGISLALRLAELGKRVVVLEGGGALLEQRSQKLYDAELSGLTHRGVSGGRFRALGGTTTEWGGQILELDTEDFERRPHVPGSGWPISKQQLRSFYDRASTQLGLDGGLPSTTGGRASLLREQGLREIDLGEEFRWSLSRFMQENNFAKHFEAKLQAAKGIKIYQHANVVGIESDTAGTGIGALRVRGFSGREARVTADEYVFCLGGIETTRLLLQPPAEGRVPWQSSEVLGKHFHDHIACRGIPIRDVTAQPMTEYFGSVESRGYRYRSKIQMRPELQAEWQTLNVAAMITPYEVEVSDRQALARQLRRLRRREGEFNLGEMLRLASNAPEMMVNWAAWRVGGGAFAWRKTMLLVHCEQEPLSKSSITLSDERDAMGMRLARLDWRITPTEIRTIRDFVGAAAESFDRRGLACVDEPEGFYEDDAALVGMCTDSNHHMGTTRMSETVADGAVDRDLRMHGVSNGFVCSSSVFPSGGFSNPTYTVVALALRLAERLGR